MTWSTVADVARPPLAVFLQGYESGIQRRTWRGPLRIVEWSGSDDITLSSGGWCAAALRRRVPHGNGFLGAVQSASSGSLSAWGHAWLQRLMCVRLSLVVVVWRGVEFEFAAGLFSVQPGAVESSFEWSCVAALMSQSNRHVLLFFCCAQSGRCFFFLI